MDPPEDPAAGRRIGGDVKAGRGASRRQGALHRGGGPPVQISGRSASKTSSEIPEAIGIAGVDRDSTPGAEPPSKIREGAARVGAPPFKYLAGLVKRRYPNYTEITDFPRAGNSGEHAIAICSTWR